MRDYTYVIGSAAFIVGLGLVWGPGGLFVAFGLSAMAVAILDGTHRPPSGKTTREPE